MKMKVMTCLFGIYFAIKFFFERHPFLTIWVLGGFFAGIYYAIIKENGLSGLISGVIVGLFPLLIRKFIHVIDKKKTKEDLAEIIEQLTKYIEEEINKSV